ncbi:MAG: transcriptional repressor [Bacteroidota bacterium]
MRITKDEARQLLRKSGLRVTSPRVAVLGVLAAATGPLSFTQVLAQLGETGWDQATIYRNLVKLREAGLAPVVSRVGGVDQYAIGGDQADDHRHPHFLCEDCGRVACLSQDLTAALSVDGPWAESIQGAVVHLLGHCPDCIARPHV